uniref:Grass carp reovirus (GCRV)-induced gene 2o n=1 Tax=Lepisosteus oculatus TaxID=7918 RepID=W5NMV6_LEPOC|nr:PREDICTED: uncharacterized protein LOC102691376 [Lepisosteus oculatus]
MTLSFSGWQVLEDRRRLRAEEEPQSGRAYTMYHGTHLAHAKAIVRAGFRRSGDGLLGAGVYVSRNIEKAKCYPLGAGRQDKVVFKLKVRVGRVKKIDRDDHPLQKTWHQQGYDSAWVPPHSRISSIKSGREEDCVWDPRRIALVDVACCADAAARRELRRMIRGHRGGSPGGGCRLCHGDAAGRHPAESCWACGRAVCPFQSKHACKKRRPLQAE